MSNVTAITSVEQFDKLIADNTTPILVDFYADWCGPCQAMMPVVDNVKAELADKATVVKVNVDEVPDIAQRFGVMSIPTFIVMKDGAEHQRHTGSSSMEELTALTLS
jgi:thioredoxin 1